VGKKYGSGAVFSHKGGLFTKMGVPAGHNRPVTRAAKTFFASSTIYAALTGA